VIPLVSVAVATTLLPIILSKVGGRLDWPHVRSDDHASRAWTAWARLVVRRRWPAAVSALAVLAALAVAATSMNLGAATGEPNTISQGGDATVGLDALEHSGIGAGVLSPIEIVAPTRDSGQLVARCAGCPESRGRSRPAAPAGTPAGRLWSTCWREVTAAPRCHG